MRVPSRVRDPTMRKGVAAATWGGPHLRSTCKLVVSVGSVICSLLLRRCYATTGYGRYSCPGSLCESSRCVLVGSKHVWEMFERPFGRTPTMRYRSGPGPP